MAKELCDVYVRLHIAHTWKKTRNNEWNLILQTQGPGPFAEDDDPPPPSLKRPSKATGSVHGLSEEQLVTLLDVDRACDEGAKKLEEKRAHVETTDVLPF